MFFVGCLKGCLRQQNGPKIADWVLTKILKDTHWGAMAGMQQPLISSTGWNHLTRRSIGCCTKSMRSHPFEGHASGLKTKKSLVAWFEPEGNSAVLLMSDVCSMTSNLCFNPDKQRSVALFTWAPTPFVWVILTGVRPLASPDRMMPWNMKGPSQACKLLTKVWSVPPEWRLRQSQKEIQQMVGWAHTQCQNPWEFDLPRVLKFSYCNNSLLWHLLTWDAEIFTSGC